MGYYSETVWSQGYFSSSGFSKTFPTTSNESASVIIPTSTLNEAVQALYRTSYGQNLNGPSRMVTRSPSYTSFPFTSLSPVDWQNSKFEESRTSLCNTPSHLGRIPVSNDTLCVEELKYGLIGKNALRFLSQTLIWISRFMGGLLMGSRGNFERSTSVVLWIPMASESRTSWNFFPFILERNSVQYDYEVLALLASQSDVFHIVRFRLKR